MALEICVIDTDTGLLYEWNGARTVNIYNSAEYCVAHLNGEAPVNVTDDRGFDVWTMGEGKTAEDFIASVVEHISGEDT